MAKNKVQYTENQQMYRGLRTKIKRKLRDIGKRGYILAGKQGELLAEIIGKTEPPKRVTKRQLEKLNKILSNIYEYVKYYSPTEDKYIAGTERRQQERKIAARKAAETRRKKKERTDEFWDEWSDEEWEEEYFDSMPNEPERILDTITDLLSNWIPSEEWSPALSALKEEDFQEAKNIIDGAINTLGKEQVVQNIKYDAEELLRLVQEIVYQSGNKYKESGREHVRYNLNRISAIIYGRPLTVAESLNITQAQEKINEYS